MCKAKQDALQDKYQLEREVAELKNQLQGEQPPAKRQKIESDLE